MLNGKKRKKERFSLVIFFIPVYFSIYFQHIVTCIFKALLYRNIDLIKINHVIGRFYLLANVVKRIKYIIRHFSIIVTLLDRENGLGDEKFSWIYSGNLFSVSYIKASF